MRSREAAPALLHAACCHEHRDSTPGMPPADLCSGSWRQVCWAAFAIPAYGLLLSSQLLLDHQEVLSNQSIAAQFALLYTDVAPLLVASREQGHPR